VKTIKNKTFILAPKFECTLMLILLLSSLMITTVWAKKPENPGKPSDPEPVIADYNIWIGDVGQDIVLADPSDLFVEGVEAGYWLPPQQRERLKKKGFGEPAYNWEKKMFANILLQMI
jgi:hypothetical protein